MAKEIDNRLFWIKVVKRFFEGSFTELLGIFLAISYHIFLVNTAYAKDVVDQSNPYFLSEEKRQKIQDVLPHIAKTFAADLFKTNHFKSFEGKQARQELLKFSNGQEKSIDNAISLLKKAVEKQDPHAYAWMGALHQVGVGSLVLDFKKSIEFFSKAAELNDPYGLYSLGFFYERGSYGFEQNKTKAFEYYDLSINSGGHWALKHLGDAYNQGSSNLGIERDIKEAINLYKYAIEKGGLNANVSLTEIYIDGNGIDLSVSERMSLTDKLGRELCETKTVFGAKGCFYRGLAEYEQFRRLDKDIPEKRQQIIELLEKSYQQGNGLAEAMAFLALAQVGFNSVFDPTVEEIRTIFELACPEKDDDLLLNSKFVGRACLEAGSAFVKGDREWNGNKIDVNRAVKYFNVAQREGYAAAYSILGYYYMEGFMGEKNLLKAYALIKNSVEKFNDPRGLHLLSFFYIHGIHVQSDISKAKLLLERSAKLGSSAGMEKYASRFVFDLKTRNVLKKPDFEKCFLWGSLARIRGLPSASGYEICGAKLTSLQRYSILKRVKKLDEKIPVFE